MNNPADVPLLTAAYADDILGYLWNSKGSYGGKKAEAMLSAIVNKAVITKSAAAEEADRARIVRLSAALERLCEYADVSDDFHFFTLDTTLVRDIGRQALSGASENG